LIRARPPAATIIRDERPIAQSCVPLSSIDPTQRSTMSTR
jgi:hypothetical protein